MRLLREGIGVLLVAALLGGCVGYGMEQPRVTLSDITVKDARFLEQVFEVKLRVMNPNDTELTISGLAFDVELNDAHFASGVSGERVTVPRFGSAVITAEAVSGIAGIVRQLAKLAEGRLTSISYRISGKVYLGSWLQQLPFAGKGEIKLPGGTEPESGSEKL
jgi:LEA14-like dessication related protein